MKRPFLASFAIAGTLLLAHAAAADMILGTSGNPTVELNGRLASLMEAEGRTLAAVDQRGIDRLTRSPSAGRDTAKRTYSSEFVDALPAPRGGKQWSCLSQALYFEARGEKVEGIFAVAEVILNRVDDPRYPSSVCEVVNQGTGERYRCQFTYTCDGRPETIVDTRAYKRMGKIAQMMIDSAKRPLTKGATHYHTKAVKPKWARVFPRTTTIGFHHFYRQPTRVASR